MKSKILMATLLSGVVMTAAAVQAQDVRERPDFATIDANSDGAVTIEEMQAHATARFALADKDGDGALSIDELTSHAAAPASDRALRMLERLDDNNDGLLQQAEMEVRGDGRMEQLFTRLDTDEDGALSEAEFQAGKEHRAERRGERDGQRDNG